MIKFIELLDSLKIEHTGAKKRYKDKEHSAYSVYIRSNSASLFFKYIYNNSTLFLERKQKIDNMADYNKRSKINYQLHLLLGGKE